MLKKCIKCVLEECGLKSDDHIVEQLYKTAMVESRVKNVRQYGGGPALGYFQIEPRTRQDVLDSVLAYRKKTKNAIENAIGTLEMTDEQFLQNVWVQIIFAYFCYDRYKAWGFDTIQQAIYWKQYYNTIYGKGTIKKFVEVVNGYEES